MPAISISQLKINPSSAIAMASDYPMAIKNKGQTTAYLVGQKLFDKIVASLENFSDKKAVKEANYKSGRNFEDLATELGI